MISGGQRFLYMWGLGEIMMYSCKVFPEMKNVGRSSKCHEIQQKITVTDDWQECVQPAVTNCLNGDIFTRITNCKKSTSLKRRECRLTWDFSIILFNDKGLRDISEWNKSVSVYAYNFFFANHRQIPDTWNVGLLKCSSQEFPMSHDVIQQTTRSISNERQKCIIKGLVVIIKSSKCLPVIEHLESFGNRTDGKFYKL